MKGAAAAIARREWSGYFNSPVAYVFIVIYLALMAFFTFAVSRLFESGQADLTGFFYWHPWLYLVLVPAVGMGLWSEERRSHTVELLLTLPVTHAQAIAGKFVAGWLFLLTALALTLPIVATVYYLGGDPDAGVIFSGYVGSALLAGAYLSIAMFASALTKSPVISFVISVVIGLFLILAGFGPVTNFMVGFAPSWLVNGIAGLSFMAHYESLQRGVIDFRDLVYFASIMLFMGAATHVVLRDRAAA